jgi:non-specific serine/threonine protein kinase
MRQCPLCSSLYADSAEFCPQDGRVLFLPDPLLGRLIDGKYRIEALMGGGGQGAVYRATHVHLRRPAAIKVVRGAFVADPAVAERFKREALAVAHLKHPYIVTVHDFGVAQDIGAYLVMEYLEGHSLCDEIRQGTRIPLGQALELMRQICAGVQAAHENGVIHRDLKPDNIFLEARADHAFAVKILDFGIAELWGSAGGQAHDLAGEGAPRPGDTRHVFGTPAYMSPEQCLGEPLDARTDVYSLGCVFYEMITGRPPFMFTGTTALDVKHLRATPQPPSALEPSVPEALDAVLLRALAKDRDARFMSAEELGRAVAALGVSVGPGRPAPFAPASPEAIPVRRSADTLAFRHGPGVEPPHNLPEPVTSFIGRGREIAAVERLLSENRLVTLTGPGGCGKTRLALEVARQQLPDYVDGVWLVGLAALADLSLVPQAVASALGVSEEPRQALVDAIIEYLQHKRALLVLDNCEHLTAACAPLVGALLRACRRLRVLATSQHALGAPGEATWQVLTLSLPDASDTSPESIERSEAARLFVERARLGRPDFSLDGQNASVVAEICAQLDGIPLAIELAAARTRLLSPEQIAERLGDRFRLLVGGDRTAQARQRTLQGAIDWSYELLSPQERSLFDCLSVFAGGFTLEAAEEVCGGGSGSADVLELLSELADKSLLVAGERDGRARYRLLETLRQYGARKLHEEGGAGDARARHRDYFLRLAQTAEARLSGPEQGEWLDRLEVEHDNLRAALEWSKADASTPLALLRLAGALAKFWHVRGHWREGTAWLEAALSGKAGGGSTERAKALDGAGVLARVLGNYGRAATYHQEALELYRAAGDVRGQASALNSLGFVAQWQGDYGRAARLHEEALALARAAGDRGEIANSLNYLGISARSEGDVERAAALFEECLALFRELGDEREIANSLNNLAVVLASRNDLDRARALFEENLELRRRLGDKWGTATSINNLGQVALLQGELDRAAALLKEGLTLYSEAGDRRGMAYSLEGFVGLAAALGEAELALELAGATAALREAIGSPLSPAELAELDRQLEGAREVLGPERSERALEVGKGLSAEQALARALEMSASPPPSAGENPQPAG